MLLRGDALVGVGAPVGQRVVQVVLVDPAGGDGLDGLQGRGRGQGSPRVICGRRIRCRVRFRVPRLSLQLQGHGPGHLGLGVADVQKPVGREVVGVDKLDARGLHVRQIRLLCFGAARGGGVPQDGDVEAERETVVSRRAHAVGRGGAGEHDGADAPCAQQGVQIGAEEGRPARLHDDGLARGRRQLRRAVQAYRVGGGERSPSFRPCFPAYGLHVAPVGGVGAAHVVDGHAVGPGSFKGAGAGGNGGGGPGDAQGRGAVDESVLHIDEQEGGARWFYHGNSLNFAVGSLHCSTMGGESGEALPIHRLAPSTKGIP